MHPTEAGDEKRGNADSNNTADRRRATRNKAAEAETFRQLTTSTDANESKKEKRRKKMMGKRKTCEPNTAEQRNAD